MVALRTNDIAPNAMPPMAHRFSGLIGLANIRNAASVLSSEVKCAGGGRNDARDPAFRRALFRQEEFLRAQAQQTAACNAKHKITNRLATWLLRARDATTSDELWLTQEFLAQMLGIQRASVSMAAGGLAASGTIEYRRGRIKIVNPEELTEAACECHGTF